MEHVNHHHALDDTLNTPNRTLAERLILNPDISEERLEFLYGKMAEIFLQLSLPSLPRIGSFSETGEYEWSVTERPHTYNLNSVCVLGGFPLDRLPTGTFSTASSYYLALADMHLEHLRAQHNDAIDSEHDCRKKYVARQLFRNLAAENRLDPLREKFDRGPFKLCCSDLRPTNVLVTEEDAVAGVVDWEFTIAAPAGFAFNAPWWLLLEHPTQWHGGLDDWEETYARRLETFLRAMEGRERVAREKGVVIPEDQVLSKRMRESWESGAFWVNYAAQHGFFFDHIYFNRLDEKFFGKVEGDWFEERLKLITEEQRMEMEPFVQMKMAQKAARRLGDGRFDGLVEMFESDPSE